LIKILKGKTQTDRKNPKTSEDEAKLVNRSKRQLLPFAGGFGVGFSAYDYNDYYGDYASDYNYDYYDWVCSELSCQLCNILTSECCDPAAPAPTGDPNCFLPDSCLNNPCLAGGTCITTRTLDDRPDFICVCLPGLTGKYCQLWNDYFIGADILPVPVPAPVPSPFGGSPMAASPAQAQNSMAYNIAAQPAAASMYGAYNSYAASTYAPVYNVPAGYAYAQPSYAGQAPQGQAIAAVAAAAAQNTQSNTGSKFVLFSICLFIFIF
jgi:hypothetical protein